MNRKSTIREKIAVTGMFIIVLVVFSFANKDTEKLIELHTRSASTLSEKQELTASLKADTTIFVHQ